MCMNLRFHFYFRMAQTECLDGKVQVIAIPIRTAQRQFFTKSRFIDLDDTNTCRFQVKHFFTDGQTDLVHHFFRRNIFTREGPIQDGHRTCQHAFYLLLCQAASIRIIICSNRLFPLDVTEHDWRFYATCAVGLYPRIGCKHIAFQVFSKKFHHVIALELAVHQYI